MDQGCSPQCLDVCFEVLTWIKAHIGDTVYVTMEQMQDGETIETEHVGIPIDVRRGLPSRVMVCFQLQSGEKVFWTREKLITITIVCTQTLHDEHAAVWSS